MSLATWLGAIAVGMVVCVAVAPVSSWSFKNDWASLPPPLGDGTLPRPGYDEPLFPTVPKALLDAKQIPDSTREGRLARALGLAEWDQVNPRGQWDLGVPVQYRALESYCRDNPTDAVALAHFVRLGTQAMPLMAVSPELRAQKRYQDQVARMRPHVERLATLSAQGAALEPGNAYWPLLEAAARLRLAHPQPAREAFLRASDCGSFDDHALADAQLGMVEFEKRWGYRGGAVRLMIPASVLFPHFARFKALFKDLCTGDNPEELRLRWAGVKLASLLERDGTTAICILVGRACLGIAVTGNQQVAAEIQRAHGEERAQELHQWQLSLARDLDKDLKDAGIQVGPASATSMLADSEKLLAAVQFVMRNQTEVQPFEQPYRGVTTTAFGLWMILLFVPTFAAVWAWSRLAPDAYDRSRLFFGGMSISTGLLLLRATSADVYTASALDGWVYSMLALSAITFLVALWGASRRALLAMCLLMGLTGVMLVWASPVREGALFFCIATAAYLSLSYRYPERWFTTLALCAIALALVFSASRLHAQQGATQVAFVVAAEMLLLCAVPAKRFANWAAAVGLLAALCYVGATAYNLKTDAELRAFGSSWLHEGELIRERAGMASVPDRP